MCKVCPSLNVPTLIVSWISWEMLPSLILSSKSPKVTFFPLVFSKLEQLHSSCLNQWKISSHLFIFKWNMWLMALSRNWSNLTHYPFSSYPISFFRENPIWGNQLCFHVVEKWTITLFLFWIYNICSAQNWPLNIIGLQEESRRQQSIDLKSVATVPMPKKITIFTTKYGYRIWNQLQMFQCQ